MTLAADLAAAHRAAFTQERPWSADEFAALLAEPSVILCGDSQSFVLGRVILDEAEVLTLATLPAARRKGLARRALGDFADQAKMAGASRLFLEVAEDNFAAISLYLQAGFAQVGRRAGYYKRKGGPVVAALVLARDL